MSGSASVEGEQQGVQTMAAAEQGRAMAERKAWSVIQGQRKPVKAVSTGMLDTLREGTTGRVVCVPRIWAVAEAKAPTAVEEPRASAAEQPEEELRFYRKYTEGLLRRYTQMTLEAGRVPSLMGREVLGGSASSYRIHGFDDAVNFRIDVEKCLKKLDKPERDVLRRIAMQEYTQAEAAPLLGISLRTCVERYGRSLDKLTGILLRARLLEPFKALSSGRP